MSASLICVNIGNTSVNVGVRVDGDWSPQVDFETDAFDPIVLAPLIPAEPAEWLIASVNRPSEQRLRKWVGASRGSDVYKNLTHEDLGLAVAVDFPDRVGMDRLVAAVATNHLREPHSPVVIVDAGTAITVDLVDASGIFRGGAILPGFRLVARALAAGTDQLPDTDPKFRDAVPAVVGKSTEQAIRSGLFWGGLGAVRELVTRITAEIGATPQLFVTGGDAERLTPYLDPSARFISDLVLQGLVVVAEQFQR